ncbi:MAG: short subunit dehydrogenase-like uncharacterized protein [Myxococcota bacterium]|jgi:short subunit dehydrogenase-like uncharacterized protein
MTAKQYDVILYGATGFTGTQAARYMERAAPEGLRWAIAGRNEAKLNQMAEALSGVAGVVVADSTDPASIEAMVAQTRVVMTTAGPYALYGEPVIAACVKQGVDYADITGESTFIRRMIDRYHDDAAEAGVRIVPFCGFDSIPSDIGTLMMVNHLRAAGLTCRRVWGYFKMKGGGLNGGTLASALNMIKQDGADALESPFLLNPDRTGPADFIPDLTRPREVKALGGWGAPFFMAPVNSRVVRRSAALSASWGEPYGEGFDYMEALGPVPLGQARMIAVGMGLVSATAGFTALHGLASRFGPAPGEGPSEEQMASGALTGRFIAEATDGQRFLGSFKAQGDSGNRVTTMLLSESAMAMALQRDALPGGAGRGGVLTPATALGDVLIARLKDAGVAMGVESLA